MLYTHVTQTSESQALLEGFDMWRFVHVQPPPWQRLATSQTSVVTNLELEIAWNRRIERRSNFIELHQSSKCSKRNNLGILAFLRQFLMLLHRHALRALTKRSCFWAWASSRDSVRINKGTNSSTWTYGAGPRKSCNNYVAEVKDRASSRKAGVYMGEFPPMTWFLVAFAQSTNHGMTPDQQNFQPSSFRTARIEYCIHWSDHDHMISNAGSHLSA